MEQHDWKRIYDQYREFICSEEMNVPSGTIGVAGMPQKPILVIRCNIQPFDLQHNHTAKMISELSQDGNAMDIGLDLKLPWPCKSSTIKAKLSRS